MNPVRTRAFVFSLLASVAWGCDDGRSPAGSDATHDPADVADAPDAAGDATPDTEGDTRADVEVTRVDAADAADGSGEPRVSAAACLRDPECDQVMVVAHRGLHVDAPENSLASIRGAARVGAEFAEIDVRHTSDDVLVLMHDGTVDRTTDGSGDVSTMTWAQLRELTLDGGDPADPESHAIPLFGDALAVAAEEGVMLYLDQKTDRWDLVLEALRAFGDPDVALVRDDLGPVTEMAERDDTLLYMVPVGSEDDVDTALAAVPNLAIVEIGKVVVDPALTAAAIARGLHVQQDVMALGDIRATLADYTAWREFVDAGVGVLQTNLPEELAWAVEVYRRTGVFPDGPNP